MGIIAVDFAYLKDMFASYLTMSSGISGGGIAEKTRMSVGQIEIAKLNSNENV